MIHASMGGVDYVRRHLGWSQARIDRMIREDNASVQYDKLVNAPHPMRQQIIDSVYARAKKDGFKVSNVIDPAAHYMAKGILVITVDSFQWKRKGKR